MKNSVWHIFYEVKGSSSFQIWNIVTLSTLFFFLLYRLSFQCLTRNSGTVRRSVDALTKLLGALEISLATGNTGTGMCQWGVSEHGCEYTPVAGRNNEFIEIPSAPCGFDVASATGGQFWNPMSKQPERQSAIKKNKVLRVTRYFISIKKKWSLSPIKISYSVFSFCNRLFNLCLL